MSPDIFAISTGDIRLSHRARRHPRSAADALDKRSGRRPARARRSPSSDRARRRRTRSKWRGGWAPIWRGAASRSSAAWRAASIRRRTAARSRRRRHGRGVRLRRRRHLSARACGARRADLRARRARQRVPARHASLERQLSAAQPHHQRAVSRRGRRRGGRRQRVADHRRLRARAGARRSGGAGQRARAGATTARTRSCATEQSWWSVRTISWRSCPLGIG